MSGQPILAPFGRAKGRQSAIANANFPGQSKADEGQDQLREGEVALMENYALEDWELDAGFTLPCQAEPISAQITLDYDRV